MKSIDVMGKNALMTQAIKAIAAAHPDVSILLVSVDNSHANAKKHKGLFSSRSLPPPYPSSSLASFLT